MSERILYKDGWLLCDKQSFYDFPMIKLIFSIETASSVLKVANEKNEVEIKDIVVELSNLIEKNYDGKSLQVYKGN
jgi:hypothetical protein